LSAAERTTSNRYPRQRPADAQPANSQ
jgi:hypothetical protein